ncbi:hypothetical protein DMN91_012698 [Ooceraea biroi]|uniref:Uncharacterized protein n=1 Tax=Ooceraea biroi TaxID=2015173 RepID=A0A3L8D3U4_OOCBI|nr:hypothetical protein DMN91_012698 [Ooceraea biroi]
MSTMEVEEAVEEASARDGAKLALRQKTEEANAVPTSATAVTPAAVTSSNSTTTEPNKQSEKQQENTHETKDNIKDPDSAKPKKEENAAEGACEASGQDQAGL